VETLHGWIKRGKLDLQPDFQRYFVWNHSKASRLIESLLLDIPIPVIYVAEEANKTYSVVDDQQRLTSIGAFIDGAFPDQSSFRLSSLRFFAMWRNTHLRYKGPMKHFLNREIEDHRNASERENVEMREAFEKSIEMACTAFGPNAFHRFHPGLSGKPNGSWEKNKLNVASLKHLAVYLQLLREASARPEYRRYPRRRPRPNDQ